MPPQDWRGHRARSAPIRIVNYAIDGEGLGHVTRLIAIGRWIRRLAAESGVRAEIYFLTSSEATHVLYQERFVSLKVAMAEVAEEGGLDPGLYRRFAGTWLRRGLDLLKPDLLIVDTFPRGVFHEFPNAWRACRTKAFIYRPTKPAFTSRLDYQAALLGYDAILVPEFAGQATAEVPPPAADRLQYIGPVVVRERHEILTRQEARQQLGISDGQLGIYLSMGGSGDSTLEAVIRPIVTRLGDLDAVHIVVGAGPLYRGAPLGGAHLTWLTRSGICELMNAFDVAISAGGYNSFVELMHFGVPTIFLPRWCEEDDQHARAQRAVAAGAAVRLDPEDLGGIVDAVERWRDVGRRQAASDAARGVVPVNCAREFAVHLLNLATRRREKNSPLRTTRMVVWRLEHGVRSFPARLRAAVPRPLARVVRAIRSRK